MEVVWATKYWPNRVFSFLLGVTEVNVNLTTTHFCGQNQKGQIEFRKLLAKTLIFNTYYNEEQDKTPDKKREQQDFGHCLIMLPKGKIFQAQELSQENVNIHNTNVLHAPNILPLFPRNLSVCRMFWIPSGMYQKQSFDTDLPQKHKKWHANDHQ